MKPILYKNKFLLIPNGLPAGVGRRMVYHGKSFTVLPWCVKTFVLCKRLGIPAVPKPTAGYDFSKTLYTPYTHQVLTTDFLLEYPQAFCWNDAGTGKTASCIWAYDRLRNQGVVKKLLVICTLSTVEDVWGKHLFQMFPALKHEVLVGSRAKRIKLLEKNLDVYVINHDGIKLLDKVLRKWKPDLIIVDEHTAFKNKKALRWKVLRDLCVGAQRVWMLSATPAPLSPLDLYAPGRIICPETVGTSFVRFRDKLMIQVGQFKWVPRPNWEGLIKDIIKPVIRFKREECLDLPPLIYQTFHIELSSTQRNVFDTLRKKALIQCCL